jgi:drug/metabolite transporter (DMT)-like permease
MAAQRVLAISLVIVIGVLAVVAGVIYLTVEAKSLPSFLGALHNDTAHRSLRGIVALVVGAVLLAGGSAMIAYRPRSQR